MANPGSIAIFGASNNYNAMGSMIFDSLKALDYEGPIYPVHPKEEKVMDVKAFKSIQDLSETPDLAVIVLPNEIVPQIVEDCGKNGIRQAIVVSGGFKEVGDKGAVLEKDLAKIADRYDIRLLGPNCLGVANPHDRLNTTPFRYEGAPGSIGLASQSGSFVGQMFDHLSELGVGFSTALSVGNEVDIDIVDCMEYLGVCPNTKVIGLYIEGIKRGKEFVETARSIVPDKPIVTFYAGGSESGKRAGLSHTGAMSGPDQLYDGVFRQSGIIRAGSITELFDFCWVLSCLPSPKGSKVVIQTNSGGPGTAAADACGREDLELPSLSKETIDILAPLLPHTASVNNPVDLTFTKNPLDYFSNVPEALLKDKNCENLLIYFLFSSDMIKRGLEHMGVSRDKIDEESNKVVDAMSRSIADLLKAHGKPIVAFTFRSLQEKLMRGLINRGVPVFPDPERAVRATKALVQYTELRDNIIA